MTEHTSRLEDLSNDDLFKMADKIIAESRDFGDDPYSLASKIKQYRENEQYPEEKRELAIKIIDGFALHNRKVSDSGDSIAARADRAELGIED